MGKIADILKDSERGLSLFPQEHIEELEKNITSDNGKNYVQCFIRDKKVILKQEELIRQLYAMTLVRKYEYPKGRIKFEQSINFGREIKRADIVIISEKDPTVIEMIIEVKRPKEQDGKAQLRSYTNATGAEIAIWTNGERIAYYHRRDPNYFEDINEIPNSGQSLADILKEKFTIKDLIVKDKIANEMKSLKAIILGMEDEVLANAGVDVFEEVFKLIFIKVFDESEKASDREAINRYLKKRLSEDERKDYKKVKTILNEWDEEFTNLKFRNSGESAIDLKEKIEKIFQKAKIKWPGIFDVESQIQLTPSHLAVCVSNLQSVKLFNSNLQVVDEAFEYLVSKSAKGEKGQFFTPRHVIDMCVKMLSPKLGEYMIDTAAGSCGFPVHTMFHMMGNDDFFDSGISNDKVEDIKKIFGIDFDEKVVRVARMLNLIAGDGHTNVLHLNNLDYTKWNEVAKNDDKWQDIYRTGFRKLQARSISPQPYKEFDFDIVMANPPFAGDIKEERIIYQYELGFKDEKKTKAKTKVGRDILFIERNLNFLKPGGRMAIVLPQGRFNNTSDKAIRDYIFEEARILAVVGLDGNTFKPHTGTKTSVLFLQKWNENPDLGPLCKKEDDYEIFFAVSEKPGKDNSGDYIFAKDENNQCILDKNRHLIVVHDLYAQEGVIESGIAEAFAEWAEDKKFSFR